MQFCSILLFGRIPLHQHSISSTVTFHQPCSVSRSAPFSAALSALLADASVEYPLRLISHALGKMSLPPIMNPPLPVYQS